MSDFLSNLIMRSLKPALIIMPRLPSLYEGPVVSDAPAAERAIQEESGELFAPDETKPARPIKAISEFTPPDDSSFIRQSPRSQEADTPRATGIRDFDSQRSEEQSPVAPPHNAQPPLVATDREPEEHISKKSPNPDFTNTQAAQKITDYQTTDHEITDHKTTAYETPLTSTRKHKTPSRSDRKQAVDYTPPTSTRRQGELPSAQKQQLPDQATREKDAPRRDIFQRDISQRNIPQRDTLERSSTQHKTQAIVEPPETRPARVEVSPTVIAQPRIAAYAEPKALPVQQAAAATEPQSVINVTIGRIEVRATSSQSHVRQSSRAKSPVMSLDEYLRQRKEGER